MIALALALACHRPDDPAECVHPLFADIDGDGHGNAVAPIAGCDASAVANNDDCDDADAAIHPDATEICNGADDDCDGRVDVGSIDAPTWYADGDLDGFGGSKTVVACEAPAQFVATGGDCDDADVARNPGPDDYLGWGVGTVGDWTGDGGDEVLLAVGGKKDDDSGANGAVAVFLSDSLY